MLIYGNDDFLRNIFYAPTEGTKQYNKREELRNLIDKGKGHLLGKWICERVDKASDETINKKYAEYKPCEITEKDEKTAKALGKHVINLYSTGISQWFKIKDVKKLRRDIEDDPIIKNQMAVLGCLLACIFGDHLAPVLASVLMAAHTSNNLDSGDESENKNEGYEID